MVSLQDASIQLGINKTIETTYRDMSTIDNMFGTVHFSKRLRYFRVDHRSASDHNCLQAVIQLDHLTAPIIKTIGKSTQAESYTLVRRIKWVSTNSAIMEKDLNGLIAQLPQLNAAELIS